MDVRTEILIKGALSLIAVALVILRHRRPGSLKPRQAGQLLTVMAVVAVLAYTNFGQFHGRGGVHHWEQFHYFLGSKYFPELGYDGIYVASITAEREIDLGHGVQDHIRDLRTNEVVNIAALTEHAIEVKMRFNRDRWQAFVRDNEYFLKSNPYDYMIKIRIDHGYNPTPTWTFMARLLSAWTPAGSASLAALACLDPILLAVMFLMIFRTYGSRVGCLCLIIFGLGYPWRFDWIGGAFLRQDWLAAIGMAVCLLKRGRNLPAGLLIAYATMVRVFPGGFLIGGAILGVRSLARISHHPPAAAGDAPRPAAFSRIGMLDGLSSTTPRPSGRKHHWARHLAALATKPGEICGLIRRESPAPVIRLGTAFLAGIVLCLAAGCLAGAGPGAWPDFLHNLDKHHDTWLTNNVGLKNTMLYGVATYTRADVKWNLAEPWIIWQTRMNKRQTALRPVLIMATALFLLFIGAAAWQMEPDEAAVLGIAVAFAAVVLTCYYWIMILLVPLGRGRWGPTACWLGVNTALYALHLATPVFEVIYGGLSWAMAVFFVIWLAPDAMKSVKEFRGWIKERRA